MEVADEHCIRGYLSILCKQRAHLLAASKAVLRRRFHCNTRFDERGTTLLIISLLSHTI
jgi:hypothetical protein